MISIILMLATTILTALVTGLINEKLNTSIQGFSLMVIFPVGACLVGGLSVLGAYIGKKLTNEQFKKHIVALAMIFGAASFFAVTYVDYKFMMVTIEAKYADDLKRMNDDQKKTFYDDVSFVNYLKILHDESKVTVSTKRRKSVEINNRFVSRATFWLSVVGGAIGGWFVMVLIIGERTKDKKVGEYRDLKYLAFMKYEKYEDFEKALAEKDMVKELSKLMTENQYDKSSRRVNHTMLKVLKTRSTGEGQVVISKYIQAGKNSQLEKTIEKDLTPEQTVELMNVILSINPKEKF